MVDRVAAGNLRAALMDFSRTSLLLQVQVMVLDSHGTFCTFSVTWDGVPGVLSSKQMVVFTSQHQ